MKGEWSWMVYYFRECYFAVGFIPGPEITVLFLGFVHASWHCSGGVWPHSGRRVWWGWNVGS